MPAVYGLRYIENMKLRVSLISFVQKHVRLTFDWVKNPELQRLFLMRANPTWVGHQAYFERVLTNPQQRVYAILSEGRHVGNCGFKNIMPSKQGGELWIYIGDFSMHGQGIGKYATQLLIQEGFESLGLTMIYVHVADFNTIARKMYQQIGFYEVTRPGDTKQEWASRGYKIIRMELKKTT